MIFKSNSFVQTESGIKAHGTVQKGKEKKLILFLKQQKQAY